MRKRILRGEGSRWGGGETGERQWEERSMRECQEGEGQKGPKGKAEGSDGCSLPTRLPCHCNGG